MSSNRRGTAELRQQGTPGHLLAVGPFGVSLAACPPVGVAFVPKIVVQIRSLLHRDGDGKSNSDALDHYEGDCRVSQALGRLVVLVKALRLGLPSRPQAGGTVRQAMMTASCSYSRYHPQCWDAGERAGRRANLATEEEAARYPPGAPQQRASAAFPGRCRWPSSRLTMVVFKAGRAHVRPRQKGGRAGSGCTSSRALVGCKAARFHAA